MAAANIQVSETPLVLYALRRADDALILGHRLSEWCGHAPMMEEDMALSNIALDLIGQARELYTYAAKAEGGDNDEDKLAYLRDVLKRLPTMTNRDDLGPLTPSGWRAQR